MGVIVNITFISNDPPKVKFGQNYGKKWKKSYCVNIYLLIIMQLLFSFTFLVVVKMSIYVYYYGKRGG